MNDPLLRNLRITYYGNSYPARVDRVRRTGFRVAFRTQGAGAKVRDIRVGYHWIPSRDELDELARFVGCFEDFADLVGVKGESYRPTIYPEQFKGNEAFVHALVCAYNDFQEMRGDDRRVYPREALSFGEGKGSFWARAKFWADDVERKARGYRARRAAS